MAVPPASYASFFSGIGALDVAVRRVFPGAQCRVFVENEVTAGLRLAARMESGDLDPAPIWSDVETFPAGMFRGRTDLAVGGFPCTDLSLAGKRAGIHAERSGLFFALIRAVRELRPRYVFLENVAAIAVGRELDAVYGALAEIGFDALGASLRAADVSAPHGRDRWWCLAWDREQMADADRGERRPVGRRSDSRTNGRHHPGWCRPEDDGRLADAGRPGLQVNGQQDGRAVGPDVVAPRRGDADGCVEDVEYATGRAVRGEPRGVGSASREGSAATAGARHTGAGALDPGRGSLAVGNAQSGRRIEGRPESEIRIGWDAPDSASGQDVLPLWPPGPDDRDGWAYVLERWPHLAPAVVGPVRRISSLGQRHAGVDVCLPCDCNRGDRLRGLGNAVSVRCAEVALRLLWFRAFGSFP